MASATGWRWRCSLLFLLALTAAAAIAEIVEFPDNAQQVVVRPSSLLKKDNSHQHDKPHSTRKRRSSNHSHRRKQKAAEEDGCDDLTGTWINQLGSRLVIQVANDGHLSGVYKTAVEQTTGYAGSNHSNVKGTVNGKLVTWTVAWAGGRSLAAWTGQCFHECRGDLHEVSIHTTWTLTTLVDECRSRWSATRIGQDVFTRESLSNEVQDVQVLNGGHDNHQSSSTNTM